MPLAPFVSVSPGRGTRAAAGLLPPFLPLMLAAAQPGARKGEAPHTASGILPPADNRPHERRSAAVVRRIPAGQ